MLGREPKTLSRRAPEGRASKTLAGSYFPLRFASPRFVPRSRQLRKVCDMGQPSVEWRFSTALTDLIGDLPACQVVPYDIYWISFALHDCRMEPDADDVNEMASALRRLAAAVPDDYQPRMETVLELARETIRMSVCEPGLADRLFPRSAK